MNTWKGSKMQKIKLIIINNKYANKIVFKIVSIFTGIKITLCLVKERNQLATKFQIPIDIFAMLFIA